jgi:hypothetical protein
MTTLTFESLAKVHFLLHATAHGCDIPLSPDHAAYHLLQKRHHFQRDQTVLNPVHPTVHEDKGGLNVLTQCTMGDQQVAKARRANRSGNLS